MRNVIIWGLEKRISCHALKSLEQQSVISIKAWFGERKESKLVTHNWLELVFKGFNGENLMECDEEIYQKFISKDMSLWIHCRGLFIFKTSRCKNTSM